MLVGVTQMNEHLTQYTKDNPPKYYEVQKWEDCSYILGQSSGVAAIPDSTGKIVVWFVNKEGDEYFLTSNKLPNWNTDWMEDVMKCFYPMRDYIKAHYTPIKDGHKIVDYGLPWVEEFIDYNGPKELNRRFELTKENWEALSDFQKSKEIQAFIPGFSYAQEKESYQRFLEFRPGGMYSPEKIVILGELIDPVMAHGVFAWLLKTGNMITQVPLFGYKLESIGNQSTTPLAGLSDLEKEYLQKAADIIKTKFNLNENESVIH